ncbi:MAG: hypothetical protein ACRC1T_16580 [Clostridium chrysemydis]|uniref:hypothetical protein n=1 Tax=Clostridium chrysemydis TaxID=2665504 RepID=UPI003F397BA6
MNSVSFINAAMKELSSVEITGQGSNQHEFNGVAQLRRIFGDNRKNIETKIVYWDDNKIRVQDNISLTWYDARENNPTRTEYRLYYTKNKVIQKASIGDLLLIGDCGYNKYEIIVIKKGTGYYELVQNLFGGNSINLNKFIVKEDISI